MYLHRNLFILFIKFTGIVHRDLKLENILVANKEGDDKNPIFDIKVCLKYINVLVK